MTAVTPFLMFAGEAGPALALYTSLFPDAETLRLELYGPERPGPEGQVYQAEIALAGQRLRLFDSPIRHEFGFTPAVSLFVDVADEAEFDRLFAGLTEGGEVMMPPGDYGFSAKFAWTSDRFGVSWQINLPASA